MKTVSLLSLMSLFLSTVCFAQGKADIYLNKNLGFNVEGFNYAQDKLPCDIDTALVDKIIERAQAKGLAMEAVGTADKIQNGEIPVLAIDIEGLALGSKEYTFGMKTTSNLPAVRVTVGLLNAASPNSVNTAKHGCAIATLNELTPSSSVLDMGTAHTICSATYKCLNDLSNDIVQWVLPQL